MEAYEPIKNNFMDKQITVKSTTLGSGFIRNTLLLSYSGLENNCNYKVDGALTLGNAYISKKMETTVKCLQV